MKQQIATQYDNYQELLLDLDIFGRISADTQLDIKGYKELFFEEFKKQKPMPTMESKRYELSRLVDNDYRVEYNKQLELRENELLVDLNEKQKEVEKIEYEVNEKVQELFTYEKQIHDSDREEIIKKYSLDTGEVLDGVRPDELLGIIKEDDSLKLDEIEIENLGADEPIFHDETIETVSDEYEEVETNSSEDEEFEPVDLDNDFDEVETNEFDVGEDDTNEDLDEFDTFDKEDSEVEKECDNEDLDEFDTFDKEDSEVEEECDNEDLDKFDNFDNIDKNTIDNFGQKESNVIDTQIKDISNLSVDSLVQLLGNKLDANIDLEQLKSLVKASEKPKEEVSSKDSVEDFFKDTTSTVQDFFNDSNNNNNDKNEEEKSNYEPDLEGIDLGFDTQESNIVDNKKDIIEEIKEPLQQNEETKSIDKLDRDSEPKDLREFIRKHPRCEYDFATKYFTPKQIAMEIKKGRVIKKGNLLKI